MSGRARGNGATRSDDSMMVDDVHDVCEVQGRPQKRQRSFPDARADDIRRRSHEYGERFCLDHARDVQRKVADYLRDSNGDEDDASHDPLQVRVYDRTANRMLVVPFSQVLSAVPLDVSRDAPARLRATPFGQVVLNGDLHVSSLIYVAICMAWSHRV